MRNAKSATSSAQMNQSSASGSPDVINVSGATTNGLKAVSAEIPLGKITAITGVSGSGKSSFAINTVFAEAFRRSLTAFGGGRISLVKPARKRARFESISEMPPAVGVFQLAQHDFAKSQTVGDLIDLTPHWQGLLLASGTRVCPTCSAAINLTSAGALADRLEQLPTGTKVQICAPYIHLADPQQSGIDTPSNETRRKPTMSKLRSAVKVLQREGFVRLRVDGAFLSVDELTDLDRPCEQIEFVIDRQVMKPGIRDRLVDSIRLASKLADGPVMIAIEQAGVWQTEEATLSPRCLNCYTQLEAIDHRHLNRRTLLGSCQACLGIGTQPTLDPAYLRYLKQHEVLSSTSLADAGWLFSTAGSPACDSYQRWFTLHNDASDGKSRLMPWKEITEANWHELWTGGLLTALDHWLADAVANQPELDACFSEINHARTTLAALHGELECPACHGTGYSAVARSLKVNGRSIADFNQCSLAELQGELATLDLRSSQTVKQIGARLHRTLALTDRLRVAYLTADRPIATLSSGEFQRLRLIAALTASTTKLLYVLDEPTAGLHETDASRLVELITELKSAGNTLLVVDHHPALAQHADWQIEFGPGSGLTGGQIVFQGQPADHPEPTIDRYERRFKLDNRVELVHGSIYADGDSQPTSSTNAITLEQVRYRNLNIERVSFPLNQLVVVCGLSGSGKSTLVFDVLGKSMSQIQQSRWSRNASSLLTTGCQSLTGAEQITQVVVMNRRFGQGSPAFPVTMLGLMNAIGDAFARSPQAKVLGLKRSAFDFRRKEGQCPVCRGKGVESSSAAERDVDLAEESLVCRACHGTRLSQRINRCLFKGKSIGDVLMMPISEVRDFFSNDPNLAPVLNSACDLGVGYIPMLQPGDTLSGGERQRLTLARELVTLRRERVLFLIDEPSIGLHRKDINVLLATLDRVLADGHSVIVVDHHLDVVSSADTVIELGPGSGPDGGQLIFTGTPQQLSQTNTATGTVLRSAGG